MTNSSKNSAPIGVFDSGLGGLTVLREITRLLPGENTIYLGDTARVPYGNKSRETIIRYSNEIADFLVEKRVKLIVAACNTASAYGLKAIKKRLDIPVTGVIEPGARAAARATKNFRVGVIGTEGTIKSRAYADAISSADERIKTFVRSCPLFVPLAEEGMTDDKITTEVAKRYLKDLKVAGVDTLVLGCTHYPLLRATIAKVMGPRVTLIDSALSTAEEVASMLCKNSLTNGSTKKPKHDFYATDSPERFVEIGRRFFGERLSSAKLARL